MRIINCTVENFASYKNLSFDFDEQGLTLVYGPTGSGKSTLQDIPTWILYGITSKNGAVDEVCSWKADGAPTKGIAAVELDIGAVVITRIRGKQQQNDLYWETEDGVIHRGKDITDTQKLLNELLGVDSDLYSTSTCFNEFSDAALFFQAKAKDRRLLFEKVTSLSLPVDLSLKATEIRKKDSKLFYEAQTEWFQLDSRLNQLRTTLVSVEKYATSWEQSQKNIIDGLENKAKNFDKDKELKLEALNATSYRFESNKYKAINELVDKLDALDQKIKPTEEFEKRIWQLEKKLKAINTKCPTCKQSINDTSDLDQVKEEKRKNDILLERFSDISGKLREAQNLKNPHTEILKQMKASNNHYASSIAESKALVNPFLAQINDLKASIAKSASDADELHKKNVDLEYKCSALEQLGELSLELRGVLLQRVIVEIEASTNDLLGRHFDSEFRVNFELDGADNLDVQILKNGFPCVYRQLSKGQRQLLKLCFTVCIMRSVANNKGIKFNLLCFDEALDGLDSELKLKAFSLFSELEKECDTILLIDHAPEFQNLFTNKLHVTMEGDESSIEVHH